MRSRSTCSESELYTTVPRWRQIRSNALVQYIQNQLSITMANRKVTRTDKDEDGDILALCNSGKRWSPRKKHRAIRDIERDRHSYYVQENGRRVGIHVVEEWDGKHLRTDPDATTSNNLDDLPDC